MVIKKLDSGLYEMEINLYLKLQEDKIARTI